MTILKLALLAGLRIAFFSALKLALYAYILSLPDTTLADVAAKRDGRIGGMTSFAAQESNGQAGVADVQQ